MANNFLAYAVGAKGRQFLLSMLSAPLISFAIVGCYTKAELKQNMLSIYERLEQNKALVYSPEPYDMYYLSSKEPTVAKAIDDAMRRCKRLNIGNDCRLAKVNNEWQSTSSSTASSPARTNPPVYAYSGSFSVVRRGMEGRQEVQETYERGAANKALAQSDNEVYAAAVGSKSVIQARDSAYSACASIGGSNCVITHVNDAPEPRPIQSRDDLPDTRGADPKPRPVPSELVRSVQSLLAELGYDPGPADGLSGPRTILAVKQFQQDYELEPTGQITQELEVLLALVVESQNKSPDAPKAFGTGILVTAAGHVLTNFHVIDKCRMLTTSINQEIVNLQIVATDPENDLAVLKGDLGLQTSATFSNQRAANLGETVLVAGFPFKGELGDELRVTFGEISSMAGIESDRRYLQISAPVQPGNSGGPLVNASGQVIGVVTSRLSDRYIMETQGVVPQNINFAVKSSVAKSFLDIHDVPYEETDAGRTLDNIDLARLARSFTVPIDCY